MGSHLSDLEQQQANLVGVQLADFRAANLFQLVAEQLQAGHSVLDVGCGAGGLVAFLNLAGVDARGIDTSAATVDAVRGYYKALGVDDTRVRQATADQLIQNGERFDSVVCMDCLEHVEDDQQLFDELVALVKPGGKLIITVPALMALYGERDERIGHFRRYEKRELARLVDGRAMTIESLRFWNILGVAPTYISQKILGRNVDEGFRYGQLTLRKRVMRYGLNLWFRHLENRIRPPIGMTLFMVLSKASEPA